MREKIINQERKRINPQNIAEVTPVYYTKPINAQTGYDEVNIVLTEAGTTETGEAIFTGLTNPGFFTCITGIRFYFEPIYDVDTVTSGYIAAQLNGNSLQAFLPTARDNAFLVQDSGGFIPFFYALDGLAGDDFGFIVNRVSTINQAARGITGANVRIALTFDMIERSAVSKNFAQVS